MSYLSAWLSLIGWNEVAFLVGFAVLIAGMDRVIRWHDKHSWRGLMGK